MVLVLTWKVILDNYCAGCEFAECIIEGIFYVSVVHLEIMHRVAQFFRYSADILVDKVQNSSSYAPPSNRAGCG